MIDIFTIETIHFILDSSPDEIFVLHLNNDKQTDIVLFDLILHTFVNCLHMDNRTVIETAMPLLDIDTHYFLILNVNDDTLADLLILYHRTLPTICSCARCYRSFGYQQ